MAVVWDAVPRGRKRVTFLNCTGKAKCFQDDLTEQGHGQTRRRTAPIYATERFVHIMCAYIIIYYVKSIYSIHAFYTPAVHNLYIY